MWISTRGQYGLRALVELAQTNTLMPIHKIAERQDISLHYLEQILATMRRAGFVQSERGATGGYRLARDAKKITALEVIVALEGSLAPVACVEDSSQCSHVNACGTESLWRRVDATITGILGSYTVADLLEEARFQNALKMMKSQAPLE